MKKTKLKELEARLTGEEFDRLYDRAIERIRTDPEKKKILDNFNAAIQKLAAHELASLKKARTGRGKKP
jgi:hypothetical protein